MIILKNMKNFYLSFVRSHLNTKRDVYTLLLLISLLIVTFRFPIFALLNAHKWSRVTIIFPMLILILFVLNTKKISTLFEIKTFRKFIILFGLLMGLFYTAIQVFFYNISFFHVLLPNMGSTVYFLLFPLLLMEVNLTTKDYERLLDKLGFFIIFLGGPFFVVYQFSVSINHRAVGFFFSVPDKLRQLLIPDYLSSIFGSTYNFSSIRTVGHLVGLESSATILSSFSLYFFFKSLVSILNGKYSQAAIFMISYLYGILAVIKSTSLWVFSTMLFVALILSFYYFVIKRFNFLLCFLLICAVFYFLNYQFFDSLIFERVIYYMFNANNHTSGFIPDYSGCKWEELLWGSNAAVYNTTCHFGEWHFFSEPMRFGFIPFIGWLYLTFLPFASFLKITKIPLAGYASMAFCLNMMISSLHYPAIQVWSNNFIYIFALFHFLNYSKQEDPYYFEKSPSMAIESA